MTTAPIYGAAAPAAVPAHRSFDRRRALTLAAGIIIVLGMFFRFYHIDRKAFWDDEVIASMHTLGVTETEVVRAAPGFRHVSDLHAVLHPVAHARTIAATVNTLVAEDPQHPPLFYIAARLWINVFGDSVAALRMLSAVVSVAAIPGMFWLCFELFGTRRSAWLGAVFMAASPMAVLFAQQFREYSFWLVAVLLMSALFFRGLRTASAKDWTLYGGAVALALYVFPASALVAVAHGLVIVSVKTSRRNRLFALGAIATGFALFAPWLVIMLTHLGQINKGMAVINAAGISPLGVLRELVTLLRLNVLDIGSGQKRLVSIAALPIVGLTAYAVYAIRRFGTSASTLFVWTTIGCTVLPLVVLDLLTGGQRIASTRYFMPFFVAVDVAFVALFSAKLAASDSRALTQRAWLAALALILGARVASCAVSSQAQTWWNEYNIRSIAVAGELNRASNPVLVSDDYIVWALTLGEYARPTMRVALQPRCYLCDLPPAGKIDLTPLDSPAATASVYLLAPSAALRDGVRSRLGGAHRMSAYHCINVRNNCAGDISLY